MPDLDPAGGARAHIERSLANLAARTLGDLETLLPCARGLRL
ncbi:hypothetical protein OG585_48430 (plasmid) [Streptomyces sp. NBC_01340]|nr:MULTISPECIES: hypothetical protein [unclassified Streptomyces]MCX4460994.1 hypothetical protein [Streptomyces sp. NBC_01719]MCX4499677.1 hypothetical protein [Streptomyces sp. NBC_01728]WSI44836.1 hypothetical protein OG585_48430 [Streptomyces sp. NBC_01340]